MIVDVIGGDQITKHLDELMRFGDVVESSNRFANYHRIRVNMGIGGAKLAIAIVLAASDELNGYVLFAGIRGENAHFYLEPGISVISYKNKEGHKEIMFSDMLKKLGYDVVTDSTMKVTGIVSGIDVSGKRKRSESV